MMAIQLKYKKLHPDAKIMQGSVEAAAYDVVAVERYNEGSDIVVYRTGLAFDIPKGYVLKAYPRSSIANYDLELTNSVGLIDSDYTGEVLAKFRQTAPDGECTQYGGIITPFPKLYNIGDRIIQIRLEKNEDYTIEEVDEITKTTDRGSGGFGSTGR